MIRLEVALIVFAVVVVAVWALVELLAVVGFYGAIAGEKFERCPRCGKRGLTSGGVRHPDGCPEGVVAHFGRHHSIHHLHLRH